MTWTSTVLSLKTECHEQVVWWGGWGCCELLEDGQFFMCIGKEQFSKVQSIQAEVNRRAKKLENDVIDFQNKLDKGHLTRTNAEIQSQKLQQQELEFNNYAAQKDQEIQEEQVVMMNQLGDAIQTFLNKYNEEKQYAMILTNSGGAPVITANAALDITDDVLAGLNEEYIKSKNNN